LSATERALEFNAGSCEAPAIVTIIDGTMERVRPVLMTALVASLGFVPMALSTTQSAPLGRAVIGGLSMSTLSVLILLPLVFAMVQKGASTGSGSVHPEDQGL